MQSIRACRGLWFCLALMAPAASLSAEKNSAVIKDISYRGATTADRRTSLDLYLPPPSTVKPPLFIFVHGGFWLLSDDEYQIGPSIAANLSRDGVAVALVRYRLAPAYRHPAQAEDVAAAVGYLIKHASQYGFDPNVWAGMPVKTTTPGSYELLKGLPMDDFAKQKIAATNKELVEERDAVKGMLK